MSTEYIKVNEIYQDIQDIKKAGLFNFAMPNTAAYPVIQDLMKRRKVIDGYDEERQAYLAKDYDELDMDADFHEGVYYHLEKTKQVRPDLQNKLVVIFAPFVAKFAVQAKHRMFDRAYMWKKLQSRIAPNTSILRIGDSNLMSGSWYQNTEVFPDYEDKIQGLIKQVAERENIPHDHIVLYGESRGAAGALLHGLLGGYKVVAYEPTLDIRTVKDRLTNYDLTFMDEILPSSMVPKIAGLLESSEIPVSFIKILTSDSLVATFPITQLLDPQKVEMLNLDFKQYWPEEPLSAHSQFIRNNYPLVLRYLNEFLYDCDLTRVTQQSVVKFDDWSTLIPNTSRTFSFKVLVEGLEVERSYERLDDNLNFPLAEDQKLEVNQAYQLVFTEAGDESRLRKICLTMGEEVASGQIISPTTQIEGVTTYEFVAKESWSCIAIPAPPYPIGWKTALVKIQLTKK